MIFDGKPTDEIDVEELRQLLTDHVAEDRYLDYKQAAYPQNDHGTGELTKDVTAFLNADGGYLIIGVREDGQRRAEALVSIEDAEGSRRSIIDRCLARIDPRPVILDIRSIDVDGSTILVIRVPESDRKPHCALPDAEHHYFWRRYEDGNKLMTPAEIRECLEGDRVGRELANLRLELLESRHEQTVAREAEMEINEGNLFQLQTEAPFLQHMEQQFRAATADHPYYRLWATPIPVNQLNLRDRRGQLLPLLQNPPKLRASGWDVTPVGSFRQTAIGLICDRTDFRHLRLIWNGHVESWTRADDEAFHWDQALAGPPPWRFLYPYAIIEPVVSLVLLAKEMSRVAEYTGEIHFGLGLYNIQGQYLPPCAPDSIRYVTARMDVAQPYGPGFFADQNLIVPPITAPAEELPGTVAWQLVSQVYYRFGHADDQIPLFDADHQCTLGRNA